MNRDECLLPAVNKDKTLHIFILNPAAGKADQTLNNAGLIKNISKTLDIDYEIHITEYPKHAVAIVKELCLKYPDRRLVFYACGGDGTLNEVAEGAYSFENAAVTHYPCGTGNDFIKIFENHDLFNSLENLINGKTVKVDILKSEHGVALNIASVGLDADVAKDMKKYKRIFKINGELPYIISIFENMLKPFGRDMEITIDGKSVRGNYIIALISNGRYYGGGFCPVPDADPTDGMADVLVIRKLSRFVIAKVIGCYKTGKYKDFPQYIEHYRGKNIRIINNSKKNISINLDGEVFGGNRVEFSVDRQKISFVVPQKSGVEQSK